MPYNPVNRIHFFVAGLIALLLSVTILFNFFSFLSSNSNFQIIVPIFALVEGLIILFSQLKFTRRQYDNLTGYPGPFEARPWSWYVIKFVFGPVLIIMGVISFSSSLADIFPYLSLSNTFGLLILAVIGAIEILISIKD